jgi:hypothetical protein
MIARPRLDVPDVDLLRAFEPIVRYTRGESFLPTDVSTYLASAVRLAWVGGVERVLAEPGTLTDATLMAAPSPAHTEREYLTVAGHGDPESLARLLRRRSPQAAGFRHRGGRLARVGYASRIVDALFSLSLLARGRVPGALARRAAELSAERDAERVEHPYYGRVVRTATWTVLQYWFFYAFNDWRSGFMGANDHEADWEQILVYLDRDASGGAVPVWAAYAQHDHRGRDLRRRWDDADQLELAGDHPVVYAGAGSHASYFRPGEYLAEQELRLPRLVRGLWNGYTRLTRGTRGSAEARILPIAFVDYARGDGAAIGPGCERSWTPVVIDPPPTWVSDYRGLWGVSVQDPFQGEDAPAGPMFNRDGTIRTSWADPVRFAELDVEPPPSLSASLLGERIDELVQREGEIATAIPQLERQIAAAAAEGKRPSDRPTEDAPPGSVDRLRADASALYAERAENALRLRALRQQADVPAGAWSGDPQSHLRRLPAPTSPDDARIGRLLEVWAAVSIGLLLVALISALLLAPGSGVAAALLVIATFVFIESVLRRRVVDLLAGWIRVLALAAGVVLAVQFWQPLIIALAIAAGLFVLRENLGELILAARSNNPDRGDD